MCDYSLERVASRPARVGDKLITTSFSNSVTRGFAAADDPETAVCLMPGTELAFETEVACEPRFGFFPERQKHHGVARFRRVNPDQPFAHHDALELPDGEIVLLTRLVEGQRATVLQLPATGERAAAVAEEEMPETAS
jgi:hypothetical protein